MGQGWTDLCESSGAAGGDPFVPFDFIASLSGHRLWQHSFLLFGHRQWRPLAFHIPASFLWAPPVATQFSSLSYSELYVRAPSVATLLCMTLSSSPQLSGLRLWRLSFLFCPTCTTYTHTQTYIHTYIHTYTHTYIPTYIHTYIHTYISTYTYIFVKRRLRLWRPFDFS